MEDTTHEDHISSIDKEQLQEHLAQVTDYLKSDSTNEDLLTLKRDIEDAIQTTESLVEAQRGSNAPVTAVDLVVGDRIEVISGDRPYPGVITAINSDDGTCNLKYYEYGTEVTLPFNSLRKISNTGPFSSDKVAPGLKCQCKYAVDQKWYDAVVDSVTPDGYKITFTQFNTQSEVCLEYLRPLPLSVLSKRTAVAVEKMHSGMSSVVIPENLKIKPTDTEEIRAKKKKKIKAIKGKARIQNLEAEQSAVQNSWKAFVSKSTKKKSKGVVKKSSMFASPEAVDGRVGVTGSGQGMTDVPQRKKYKFSD
mmetsp:Transcript_25508/g.37646  ORF Transcript_25508/g.37646 Transcript_25508/m.37646 type:complete len:307 (+) Transcript_25508:127-1047(+)|eukprot:CAMPEP_0185031720 /NCGR_PEP_ID=MMETSP1103-20130426/19349_1 /TAXON_ID=36769 /ORGANISM="Paraphysomonas bandaiensis, Strain Caron Lab Isolate" /LENGTH=306 /DNA_ID=CAMNT_0027567341 /DNA_START=83 /DNA_END=1003 /DNA_ORIENTATION=-